jgi:hypothetical protein
MTAIALAVWFGLVGFLTGGALGTNGKLKVKFVKQNIHTVQTDNAK